MNSAPSKLTTAVMVVLAVALVVAFQVSSKTILASTLDTHADGEFFIDPDSAEINLNDSYTFNSYEQSGTKTVATDADWSIVRTLDDGTTEEGPTDLYMENCSDSSDCTVHLADVAGDLSLTAVTEDGEEATATIEVSETLAESPYTDEIPEWAAASVYLLNDRGIMLGYSNGEFGSADPVTRAQFVTLYYRILDLAYPEVPDIVSDCSVYDDVPTDHFAYEAVCFGYYGNWYEGMSNVTGTFDPDEPLRRVEAAQILANSFLEGMFVNYYAPLFDINLGMLDISTILVYKDLESYQPSYVDPIGLVSFFGLMNGTYRSDLPWEDQGWYFYPENPINRAEAAVIFTRFITDLDLNE